MSAITEEEVQTLQLIKKQHIQAPVDIVWESILEEMGPAMTQHGGTQLNMKFEPWPGGRWYRDLGDNAGHLWGHVQVIKPPKLLEICGPMFMSYPAINHVQYRLAGSGSGTTLTLTHRAIGLIDPEHSKNVNRGWSEMMDNITKAAEWRSKK